MIDHPNYSFPNNDIAVFELDADIQFNEKARPVCIPKDASKDYAGIDAVVSGWGRLAHDKDIPDKLQYTTLKVLAKAEYQGGSDMFIGGKTLGTSACMGDSGGERNLITFLTKSVCFQLYARFRPLHRRRERQARPRRRGQLRQLPVRRRGGRLPLRIRQGHHLPRVDQGQHRHREGLQQLLTRSRPLSPDCNFETEIKQHFEQFEFRVLGLFFREP